jgi:hypothetical protein
MFANKRDRRLGDFAAGTLVVHEESSVTLDDLRTGAGNLKLAGRDFADEPGSESRLPVEKLSAEDIQLVEDYLQRRSELNNQEYLASHIARGLCAKMELGPDKSVYTRPEKLLTQILLTYRGQVDAPDE